MEDNNKDYDAEGAFAFYNELRHTPVLEGESAERFLRLMEEAEERSKNPTPVMIAETKRMMEFYERVKANSKLPQHQKSYSEVDLREAFTAGKFFDDFEQWFAKRKGANP